MNTIEAVSMIGKLHIMFRFQDKSQLHPNKIIAKTIELMLQSVPASIVITILSSHVAKIISRFTGMSTFLSGAGLVILMLQVTRCISFYFDAKSNGETRSHMIKCQCHI